MDETEARRIASEWHGGQFSPLYAFASSGHRGERLTAEIEDCLADASGEDSEELRDLLDYIRKGRIA